MEQLRRTGLRGLRWLEQYTKTDMVYLAHGGFWTLASQVIVSLSTLGIAIAFAHFVSKEAYGQYKYILSFASILSTFTLTGISTAVMKSVAEGHEGTLKYAFWKNIQWSSVFFLISLGVSIYYFVHGNATLGISMLVIGSFSPFLSSTNLYNAYLVAKKDFRRSAIYFSIIGNVFPAACIFAAILVTHNPVWLVAIYFASNTLIGLILYAEIIHIYKPNTEVDTTALAYSKHLSFIGILSGIADNIDQILVFHYIGPVELAIYNFAVAIPSQIKGPMKGLAGLIMPKFAERSDAEIRAGMRNKFILLTFATFVVIGGYILIAPFIFHLFFPKYLDSIFYSQLFSLSLLSIISIPQEIYLVVKKKIKEQYIMNISVSFLQIGILFVGVIWQGLLGLVIARVVIKAIWSGVSLVLYETSSRKAIKDLT